MDKRFVKESWNGENVRLSLSSSYNPEDSVVFDDEEMAALWIAQQANFCDNASIHPDDVEHVHTVLEQRAERVARESDEKPWWKVW